LYTPRHISHIAGFRDADEVKLYGISASGTPVDAADFQSQFLAMKSSINVPWVRTPAFAIFHQGAGQPYLVLCWWGNDNELFVRVAVRESSGWIVNPDRYSFCLWDMEVMWHEQRSYIRWLYSGKPDLTAYRGDVGPSDNPLTQP
jgi:hypothetical protein